jgi:hypothetical protein
MIETFSGSLRTNVIPTLRTDLILLQRMARSFINLQNSQSNTAEPSAAHVMGMLKGRIKN